MIKLDIPYVSQHGNSQRGDCGFACLAMVSGKTLQAAIDETRDLMDKGSQWLSFQELYRCLDHFRVGFEYRRFIASNGRLHADFLRAALQDRQPVMVLGNYKLVPERQSDFTGAHWFLLTGYDADGFFVHDPNWWGDRIDQGAYLHLPTELLDGMMRQPGSGVTVAYQGVLIRRQFTAVSDTAVSDETVTQLRTELRRVQAQLVSWQQRAEIAEQLLRRINQLLNTAL